MKHINCVLFLTVVIIHATQTQGCRPTKDCKPVCGSNGKTFRNSGYFYCTHEWEQPGLPKSNVTIVHDGLCRGAPDICKHEEWEL